jgi:hypothetical protein
MLLTGAGAAIDWFGFRPVFVSVAGAIAAGLLVVTWLKATNHDTLPQTTEVKDNTGGFLCREFL